MRFNEKTCFSTEKFFSPGGLSNLAVPNLMNLHMKTYLKVAILFLSLTLIQCSADDNTPSASLTYNGAEFKLGNGSTFNTYKNESDRGIWLNIRENGSADAKNILITLNHASGSHTGTYELRNNMTAPGIAGVTIMDDDGKQLAGGNTNGPSGTVTVEDYGNHKFKVTFNDVVLDQDSATETSIEGNCTLTFVSAQ